MAFEKFNFRFFFIDRYVRLLPICISDGNERRPSTSKHFVANFCLIVKFLRTWKIYVLIEIKAETKVGLLRKPPRVERPAPLLAASLVSLVGPIW